MSIYVGVFDIFGFYNKINVYSATAAGDATPIRSISGPSTGLDRVSDIALDALGNLYVANATTSVITIYSSVADGDAAPVRTIGGSNTRLGAPGSLAIDSAGNLYVLGTAG